MFFQPDPARTQHRRAPLILEGAALFTSLAIVTVWRWLALRGHGDPVGVDFGNWLSLGYSLGGRHISGSDTVYPPLVPAVARAVTAVVGMPRAAHLVAAAAAVVPGVGVWLAVRPSVGRWPAAAAAGVVATAGATSAAAAWAGIPQLIGLGLAPIVAVSAARLVARPSRQRAVALGLAALALAATSPLVFGLTAVTAAVAVTLATAVQRSARWLRHLPLVLVFLVPVIPLYAGYVSNASIAWAGHGSSRTGGPLQVEFVGARGWWLLLGALALVAPLATWASRADPLWAASAAMTTVAAVMLLAVREPRFSCLAPTAAAVGSVMLVAHAADHVRTGALALAGISTVAIVLAAPNVMQEQTARYASFVPRGTTIAIEWTRANTRPHDLVAVAPVHGAPVGWLVEGWARRPSLVGSDPSWLLFPGERRRAALATAVFTGAPWPRSDTFARARQVGVQWLYVPSGWGGVDAAALRRAEAADPHLVAYDGPGALVLRVPGAPPARG